MSLIHSTGLEAGTMLFSFAKSNYRRFMSAIGRYWLRRMLEEGLPERLCMPLLFLLTKTVSQEDRLIVDKIEAIRSELSNRKEVNVLVYPSPDPGPAMISSPIVRPRPGEPGMVSLTRIATTSSVSRYWGTFLYLCANANRARTILEMGSCAGISGCYVASGKYCNRFITIEGSPDLAMLADSNIRQVANNVVVVNALFDDGLDNILPTLGDGLDMVYMDGHHEKIATLHYFERLIPHLNAGSIALLDDINWTPDMWEAWQTLGQWKAMSCTINLGRFGLCVCNESTTQPRNFDLSMFTELWRKGKPRN